MRLKADRQVPTDACAGSMVLLKWRSIYMWRNTTFTPYHNLGILTSASVFNRGSIRSIFSFLKVHLLIAHRLDIRVLSPYHAQAIFAEALSALNISCIGVVNGTIGLSSSIELIEYGPVTYRISAVSSKRPSRSTYRGEYNARLYLMFNCT